MIHRMLVIGCVVLFEALLVNGFATSRAFLPNNKDERALALTPPAGSFLDDWKDFFDGNSNRQNDNDDDDDELAAGEVNVVTIPVKEIKPGGLRLFLMFYLMGLQNTPNKHTWRADQPSSEDYVVDFWYHDNSAVLSVTLSDEQKKITVNRVGSQPSTAYMMQESLVVQGLLDELESMATDPAVALENRLLIPEAENSIEMAREALAFG